MVEYLKPGQEIKFNNPPAAGGYREYKMTELQGIMAGIGLPYELGTGDMSQVNYSSWRGGMLGFRNTVEAYRWLTLIPLFCMPVWRRFVDTLILQGKIPQKALDDPKVAVHAVQWTAPKFESVDPVKDAAAELKMIRTGTLDLFEAISRNGYDPEERLAEDRAHQQDARQARNHSGLRPAQRDGSRPGAARRKRGAHTEFEAHRRRSEASPPFRMRDAEAIAELFSGTPASRSWDSPSRIYRS